VPNQRAGGGAGWAAQSEPRARQLNFGASTSAVGCHSGGNGGIFIGGSSTWASSSGGHDDVIPSWPAQSKGNGGGGRGSRGGRVSGSGRGSRDRSSNRGGARGHGRGGRGGHAGRSTGPPLPLSGNYINLDEEHAWEEEEDLGSFIGPLVSNGSRAN
jgi:hypothetical protein